MKFGPRLLNLEFEVAAAEPGRRIVWLTVEGSPLWFEAGLELEPLGPDTTRVVYQGSMRMRGFWRLPEPLMAAEARAGEAAELRRLKSILESARAGAPTSA